MGLQEAVGFALSVNFDQGERGGGGAGIVLLSLLLRCQAIK